MHHSWFLTLIYVLEGSKCKRVRHRESSDCENRYNLDVMECSCTEGEDGPDNFPEDTIPVADSKEDEAIPLGGELETSGSIEEVDSETTDPGGEESTILDSDDEDKETVELNSLLTTADDANEESKNAPEEVGNEESIGWTKTKSVVVDEDDVDETEISPIEEEATEGSISDSNEMPPADEEEVEKVAGGKKEATSTEEKASTGSGDDDEVPAAGSADNDESSGDAGDEIDKLFGPNGAGDYSDHEAGSGSGVGSGSGIQLGAKLL